MYSIIRNMNLLRKSAKNSLRATVEDFTAIMEQKNAIIHSLQNELQTLRPNQQKFMRNKQELIKAKSKYQFLIQDYERIAGNNAERLELTARNIQQLRIQAELYSQELRLKGQALKEARFGTQQLVDLQNRKQDESAEFKIKFQQNRNLAEVFKTEQERTRIQLCQLREQVQKGKKENYMLRAQTQDINQKCFKTQSYIRGLAREEGNLNENFSKIEDENQKLNGAISQLSTLIAVNQSTICDKEKDIQQITFNIANKQLQKKKVENEIKEKIKLLSVEKQRSRLLTEQLEQKKNESKKIDSHLEEICADITLIFGKNSEILEVNSQLRQDLKDSEKHRENVLRNNKLFNCEIETLKDQNLQTVSKLQQPFKNRSNCTEATSQLRVKWVNSGKSSRVTTYETGDFEKRTQRI